MGFGWLRRPTPELGNCPSERPGVGTGAAGARTELPESVRPPVVGAGTAEGGGSRPAALVAAGPARLELHFPESFSRNGAELGLPQRGTSVRS